MPSPDPLVDVGGRPPAWLRSRLVAVAICALVLAPSHSGSVLCMALLCALVAIGWRAIAEPTLRGPLVRRLATIAGFAALLWLTLPWRWQDGALALSAAGVNLATLTSLRVAAIGAITIALLAGLSGPDLGDGLSRLGAPRRLVLLLQLTVRYVALLGESRQRLDRAMRARGFQPRADLRTPAVLATQVALILAHALLRGRRVALAMRARGAHLEPAAHFAPGARSEPGGRRRPGPPLRAPGARSEPGLNPDVPAGSDPIGPRP